MFFVTRPGTWYQFDAGFVCQATSHRGDSFGVPFQGDINWEDFSIKWPMADVDMGLYHYLLSMPREKLFRTETPLCSSLFLV